GKYAEAQTKLEALAKTMSGSDLQKPFVEAFLAEAQIKQNKTAGVAKKLNEAIKGSSDPRLRGVAYNLLGDMSLKSGKLEDAFWAYLRVDTLYNEDVEQQAKALYNLSTLFDKVKNNPARGRECIQRLRDARFAGTQYQKLLPPEKTEADDEPKKADKKAPKKK
ncbi:MAG: hypothetical protein AB7V46_07855, partial [Thermomicrobiales bacterium]